MSEIATVDPAVGLSASAARRLAELIRAEGRPGLMQRLSVSGGGCSGFQYGFSFDNSVQVDDHLFERDGVKVVVDKKSYLYLNGTTLDYVTQGLTGGFTFVNPQAKSSCGCGTSFSA